MGRKTIIRGHKFVIPDLVNLAHCSLHETLLFLGTPLEESEMTIAVGIGLVKTIQKGKDFDLVGMDFGRGYSREIYVKNNHARKQIYTLKKGQYAWFYGTLKCYKEGRKKKSCLFAKAFQGWYVPKQMDIEIDPNEIERLTQENESKIGLIDEILKGDG